MNQLAQLPLAPHGVKAIFNQLLWVFADLPVEAGVLQRGPCFCDRIALGAKLGELCSNAQCAGNVAAAPKVFECLQFGFHTASLQGRRTLGEPQVVAFTQKGWP